jgi:hypothetical protein
MTRILFATILSLLVLVPSMSQADEAPAAPTPDQVNIQISILTKRVNELEAQNARYRRRAEVIDERLSDAFIEFQKRDYDHQAQFMDADIEIFHVQRISSYVVLILVIIVVTSGVLFSGFQLWKSVSIAGVQTSNDLEVSAAKVRVTSSVVGIVVLAISLAFLFIYTREVYTIKVLPSDQINSNTVSAARVTTPDMQH